MKKKIKSKALKDFEKDLSKIYEKSKPILTKSKLGTTKSIKSKTTRKSSKWGSTTSTTLPYDYPWPIKSPLNRFLDKILWWLR